MGKWFSIGLFTSFLVLSLVLILTRGERVDAALDGVGAFGDSMGAATFELFRGGGFLVLGIVGTWAGVKIYGNYLEQKTRPYRMKDGAFALQVKKVAGGSVFWNPNNSMDDFAALTDQGAFAWSGDTFLPEQRVQYMIAQEQANVARAMFPGDDARSHRFGHLSDMPRSVGRALSQPKAPKQIAATPAGPILEGRMLPLLADGQAALSASRPDRWVVGQNKEDGAHAVFRPAVDVHGAIVGSSGSGKTSNVGYLLALNALQAQNRLVILDGDNGIDWSSWASVAEWHEADETNMIDYLELILAEHERRAGILTAHSLSDIAADPAVLADNPRTIVLIEEFGSLMDRLRATSRGMAARADFLLNELMRRSRKTAIHVVMLDQYPERWTDQTIVNTGAKFVFQIDGGKGAKMSAFNADNLDVGQFVCRNKQYDCFNMAVDALRIMRELPRIPQPPLIEGTVTRSEVIDSRPVEVVEPTERSADKKAAIFEWRDANPHGSQAECREHFRSAGVHVARGYVSDCFKEWDEIRAIC